MEDEGALTFPQADMDYMLADYYRIRGWGELPECACGLRAAPRLTSDSGAGGAARRRPPRARVRRQCRCAGAG